MKIYIAPTLLAVVASSTSGFALAQKADADNERQALAMVSTQTEIIEGVRKYCGNELPQWKSKIDYIAFKWKDQNIEALRAIYAFKDQDPSEKQQATLREGTVSSYIQTFKRNASATSVEGVCGGFFQQVSEGRQDVSLTPKASGFLQGYLKNHPLTPSSTDKLNFTMGCLKSGFNNRKDYDQMVTTCSCIYDVESTKVTKAERESADQTARSGGDISTLPHMKRIQPLLQSCAVRTP